MRGGGAAKDTGFKIDVPNWSVDVQQGEVKTVNITLTRGEYFKRDVKLTVHQPDGLHVEPGNVTVRAGDPNTVVLQIKVPQDAAVGTYFVRLTGEPETGAPASARFTVKVIAPKGAIDPAK